MIQYHKIPLEKLCYFAGLLDGEGCVRIAKLPSQSNKHKYDYRGSIQIGMTDERALKWVKANIGGNYYKGKNKTAKSKLCYNWAMQQVTAMPLLKCLAPYLIVKKEQAICYIQFAETLNRNCGCKGLSFEIVAYREKLYQRMRKLNKKGG